MLLDISYFVIVTTIGLNLVLGIIVDSFSVLKDERVRVHVLSVQSLHEVSKIILCYEIRQNSMLSQLSVIYCPLIGASHELVSTSSLGMRLACKCKLVDTIRV